jgi:hypothetical protein
MSKANYHKKLTIAQLDNLYSVAMRKYKKTADYKYRRMAKSLAYFAQIKAGNIF